MTEEFNIFKNLDELRKTNLLDQLKSLESIKPQKLNDGQELDDSFDFDSLLNNDNNVKKNSPTKKLLNKEKTTTRGKKTRKNENTRRSSTSTDGSISPTMPLLENLSKKVDNMPVARRTRRSLGASGNITETVLENIEPSTSRSRGRRGRGRGRGRGRTSMIISASGYDLQNATDLSNSMPHSSSNEVSEHDKGPSDHASSTLTLMERFLQQGNRGRLRVMRARRQYLAELAARSTQIDSIDLVSSPFPRVEGFIDLDSDTEEATHSTRSKRTDKKNLTINSKNNNAPLDISYDEENPELNIKVNWKGKPEAFKLRKYQKFFIIFKQLAERENISMESIVFNLNDRIIMADDTPDSINYKIFHFIDGRVLTNCFNSPGSVAAAGKKRDANNITLKIQSDKWKRPLQIDIMKNDKFRILYIKCAEELNVGLDQLKLSFDGELLEPNDTPGDLDLEGGEAIDLRII